MFEDVQIFQLATFGVYKLACLFAGAMFCYLGYKLFAAGIWGKAGDLEGVFKDNKLVLKNGAPGTFFAVLGAVIIVVTLVKGLDFSAQVSGPQYSPPSLTEPPPLP